MATIREILSALEFSESNIKGIAQLLLMEKESSGNAFDFMLSVMRKDSPSPNEKKWADIIHDLSPEAVTLPDTWQFLLQQKKLWQNSDLIEEVLDTDLGLSPKQMYHWLLALTQLQFFASSAKFGNKNGETNVYENGILVSISDALIQLIKKLDFCTAHDYSPKDGEITQLCVHAATEKALRLRFETAAGIVKEQTHGKPITIYYATNARGLWKVESSTAAILAGWFTEERELKSNIQACIQEIFSNKDIKWDWTNNLNQLRTIILDTVNQQFNLSLTEFPTAPGRKESHPAYDQAARLEGRDLLGNQWPNIEDLLQHLAKEYGLDGDNITFEPIFVTGHVDENGKYIPAETRELVEACFDKIPPGNKLYFISDNPISYGGPRQDKTVELMLAQRGRTDEVITYYQPLDLDKSRKVDFERICKEIAALLHTIYELRPQLFEDKLQMLVRM